MIVTRIAAALCLWFVACAALFAWLVRGPAGPPQTRTPVAIAGEALFDSHCGSCHSAISLSADLPAQPARAERLRELEAFLRDHGDASPDEDRLILQFLGAR